MPANSAQRLAGHVASGTGATQLDSGNIILKAQQLQFAAIPFYPSADDLKSALNNMKFLLDRWHIVPLLVGQDD